MWRSYGAVLRFEIAKAVRAKITWVTLLLPAALTALSVLVEHTTRKIQTMADGAAPVVPSAYISFSRGAGSGFVLAGVLLLLYSSMLVAHEGHWRTFKTIMLRPHRRLDWIAAKYSVLLILSILATALVSTSAWYCGFLFGEYGDIAEEGYVIFEKSFMTRSSLAAIALVLPSLIALAAFGLMFSTMTDHTGLATSSCLGSYIVLESVKGSMPGGMEGGRLYLFNTFMPSLVDNSYFQALRGFANGLSDTGWEDFVFRFNVATPLISAAAFLLVATVIFYRRNFLV